MSAVVRSAGSIAFATLVAACVVNDPESPPRGVIVSGPPPAPMREEARPPAPSAQAIWVAGYWHWTGLQYAWIPGHWEAAPAGAVWNAPRVTVHDGRYIYETGGWKNGAPGSRNAVR